MKPTTQTSFAHGHRALLAAAAAILVSAGVAVAQTGGSSGSSTSGSSQGTRSGSSSTDTSRHDQSSASDASRSSGSSYNTGSSTYGSGTGSTSGTGSASTTTDTTAAGAPTGRSSMSSDKLSWGDRRFVSKAADSGQDEINLAKLAADKASNAEVKSYAQKLVDDHTQVASELQTLASQKNVKIDKDDDKDRSYKRLSKKSGSDFDQEFVEHMIDEHEKDIKMFEKAANDAKDPEVRSFASKHVDHLRQHLQEAQSLRQTIMPTGRTDTSSSSDKSWRSGTSTGTGSSSSSDHGSTTGSSRDSSSGYSSGSSSSGTTGSSTDSSSATTPKRDGSR